MPWVAAAGAVVGAIAGSQKDKSGGFSEYGSNDRVNLQDFEDLSKGQSGLEKNTYASQLSNFADLQKLFSLGSGENEVSANTQYQNQFASQLQQLLNRSINPSQADIAGSYSKSKDLFAPEQTALNQQFQDQNTSSNRLAARLGRAGNDPILRNKLAQEQTRQQSMLNSQVGSYARQLPQLEAQQTMNIGGQLSNLRMGLATQAFQNRQTLLGMGNQLMQAERNYRLGAANRSTSGSTSGENYSGGGMKGMIGGAMSGLGAGMGMAGAMGGMGQVSGTMGGAMGGGGSASMSGYNATPGSMMS